MNTEQYYSKIENEKKPTLKNKIGRIFGAIALAATIGGTFGVVNWFNTPTFSEATHTKTVEKGDTAWDIADSIEGVDGLTNKQFAVDEIQRENGDIDLCLKPGEKITVPNAVSVNRLDQTAQEADAAAQVQQESNSVEIDKAA